MEGLTFSFHLESAKDLFIGFAKLNKTKLLLIS